MCGIVGMISKLKNGFTGDNLSFFHHLLYLNALRGNDSTGVFVVDNIGNVKIAKEAVQSGAFIPQDEYKALGAYAVQKGWAMVGHSRKATRGTVNDANAHPFIVEDKLVLVHNGSVFGDHKHLKDVEVDSEAIAHSLATSDDYEKTLRGINAAYALVWYDVYNKKLNIIRNNDRPLSWMETHTAFYFASEAGMLAFVANRTNQHPVAESIIEDFSPYSLETWQLNNDRTSTITSKALDARYVYVPKEPKHHQGPKLLEAPKTMKEVIDVMSKESSKSDDNMAANDEVVDLDTGEVLSPSQFKKEATAIIQRVMNTPPSIAPDWANGQTYEKFTQLKDDAYKADTRVKVIVKGIAEQKEDRTGTKIWLTGQTRDDNNIYTVFPISLGTFEAITDPKNNMPQDVTFMVEVSSFGWRKRPDQNLQIPMEQWAGKCTLQGKNPKIHIEQRNLH
jgi:predicted glutamine amidotransferase